MRPQHPIECDPSASPFKIAILNARAKLYPWVETTARSSENPFAIQGRPKIVFNGGSQTYFNTIFTIKKSRQHFWET